MALANNPTFYLPFLSGRKLQLTVAADASKVVTAALLDTDGATVIESADLTGTQAAKLKREYDAFHQFATAAKLA